jgi:hypothetical protein
MFPVRLDLRLALALVRHNAGPLVALLIVVLVVAWSAQRSASDASTCRCAAALAAEPQAD